MRRRRRRRTYTLPLLCLAALAAGAVLCAWQIVSARRPDGGRPGAEAPGAGAEPVELKAAHPEHPPALASPDALPQERVVIDFLPFEPETGPKSSPSGTSPQMKGSAPRQGGAKKNSPAGAKGAWDLSAYRVRPRVADAAGYLPGAGRPPGAEISGTGAGKKFDAGGGLAGDVYRGVQRFVASMDAATLDASRRALSPIAKPADAKIRPHGRGVRLHIDIPPETVRIK